MKRLFHLSFALLMCFIINSNTALTQAASHPSYMDVKIAENSKGLGLIAVLPPRMIFGVPAGKPSDPKYPSDYGETGHADYTFTTITSSGDATYYLYAVPAEGCEFDHWEGSNNLNTTDANTTFTSTHYEGNIGYSATAYFRKVGVIKRETNNNAGSITLSKDDAITGEEVTATATLYKVNSQNINMMTYFSHWEDENGNLLSYDAEYTFIAKPMTLRAIFNTKGAAPEVGKYYRVRNAYNRVLSIDGNFECKLSSTNLDVPTTLLRWAKPLDYDETQFNVGSGWSLSDAVEPLCPEASPGTLIYIESGTKSGNNLTNVSLVAQGVNTYQKMGQTLTVNAAMFDHYYGYYSIDAKVAGTDVRLKAFDRGGYGIVNVSNPNNDPMCAFAIQPVDEDHINDFWFGALADDDMLFEEGYWTTMYTTFPYRLYDAGIKAYYVKADTEKVNGITYLYLTEIEDGFIPANSAVLLKCSEPNNTKSNRLLPLDPYSLKGTQKTKTLEGNILKGELQLYTNEAGNGRINFNANTMRVLGVNNSGVVGFYKLSENTELKANKAYLDMNQLPSEVSTVSFRLAPKDNSTGIETIEEDGSSIRIEDNIVYDIMGTKVYHPIPGNIYIINGKKVLWK